METVSASCNTMGKIRNPYKRKLLVLLKALKVGNAKELSLESDDKLKAIGELISLAAEEGAKHCPIEQLVEKYNETKNNR